MAAERGACAKWFPSLFYPEHLEGVKIGLETFGYKYAMICHDKDIKPDGTPKEKHYHLVCMSEKREYQFTIAKRLGLENRFVQAPMASEPNGAIRYLTHIDNEDKPQYCAKDIDTNLTTEEFERLFVKIEKKSKDDETEELLEDISKVARNDLSFRSFLKAHPAFIYQALSLIKLVEMASTFEWEHTRDEI